MEDLISIIIPIYNAATYLHECLESIKKQTYRHFECILINDGSTDQSETIIKSFANDDCRFRLIEQNNMGVSAARNIGIINSKGNYITFVDADDWIDEQYLEILLGHIKSNNADISICGSIFEYPNSILKKTFNCNASYTVKEALISLFNDAEIRPAVWGKLYKKSILIDNEIMMNRSISYSEDTLFVTEVLLACKKISTIESTMYHYRMYNINSAQNAEKVTKVYLDKWNSRWTAYEIIENLIKESKYSVEKNVVDSFKRGKCELARDMLYLQYRYNEKNEITEKMRRYLNRHCMSYILQQPKPKKKLTMLIFIISPRLYHLLKK